MKDTEEKMAMILLTIALCGIAIILAIVTP